MSPALPLSHQGSLSPSPSWNTFFIWPSGQGHHSGLIFFLLFCLLFFSTFCCYFFITNDSSFYFQHQPFPSTFSTILSLSLGFLWPVCLHASLNTACASSMRSVPSDRFSPGTDPTSETLPVPCSSQLVKTCPFKIKPSEEDSEVKALISYIPLYWTVSHCQRFSQSNGRSSQICWGI